MKPSIKLALAAFVVISGLSLSAHAAPPKKQADQDQQDAAPAIAPTPYHEVIPCNTERGAMKAACKKNPCTATCKEATKTMKACRTQYHLPAPPIGAKQVVCTPGNVNSHPIDQDTGATIEDQGYVNGNRNGVINNNTVQPGQ